MPNLIGGVRLKQKYRKKAKKSNRKSIKKSVKKSLKQSIDEPITRSILLENDTQYNSNPIIDMLTSNGANLSLIAYTSAKGFIFNLDVTEGNSAYLGYSSSHNNFTEEVLSICLKLVIIYNDSTNPDPELGADMSLKPFPNFGYSIDPNMGNGFDEMIDKTTESKKTFFDEAKYQQRAWKSSIINNGIQVCPAVCNLSLFDNNGSQIFLNLMKNVVTTSTSSSKNKGRSNNTIEYLLEQIKNPSYSLGVLAMHTVKNSTSFDDFTTTHKITTSEGADMYVKLVAQTIRLFLQEQIIHCDLHTGNALVSMDPPTCDIIDFGRVVFFKEKEDDQFFSVAEKEEIEEKHEIYFDVFNKLKQGITTYRDGDKLITKSKFIEKILTYIQSVDQHVMEEYFTRPGSSIRDAQMSYWVNKYLKHSLIDTTILERTFELLKIYMIRDERIKPSIVTITQWERAGDLISFEEKDPLDFIVTANDLNITSSFKNNKLWICGIGICVASTVAATIFSFMHGSSSKSKKHNKTNKTNKTKKQRPAIKRIPK